ncbi:MAG: DHH family phosphoesterase [Anaerolineales bacterium]|nr:MAG: DHH family phosphoesterase [Anaerolineales bacterium]
MSETHVEKLLEAVGDASQVLILPHNNPDPDAIAAAVALRYLLTEKLGLEAHIAYRGIIARAENRALVRYLGRPLQRLRASDLQPGTCLVLVDAQPGAGNAPLSPEARVAIVIDHHPRRDVADAAAFVEVRPDVGATSTILTEYLQGAGLKPAAPIATALFYGIRSDTVGLSRGASPADTAAFCYLQSQVDLEALSRIEYAQVPAGYFKNIVSSLQRARVYENVVIAYVGPVDYPDLAAEMADILLRLRGIRWVVCIGAYKDLLTVSVRTLNQRGAGQLVQDIIGDRGTAGGHGAMAGGQIPLKGEDPDQVALHLGQRALQQLRVAPGVTGKPFI